MRETAVCDRSISWPIVRVLQRVAPAATDSSVLAITASTRASSMLRGAPGRGASSTRPPQEAVRSDREPRRCSANRSCPPRSPVQSRSVGSRRAKLPNCWASISRRCRGSPAACKRSLALSQLAISGGYGSLLSARLRAGPAGLSGVHEKRSRRLRLAAARAQKPAASGARSALLRAG